MISRTFSRDDSFWNFIILLILAYAKKFVCEINWVIRAITKSPHPTVRPLHPENLENYKLCINNASTLF